MFNYSEFPVSDKIKDFVECFWVLKTSLNNENITQEVLVPGGRAEFIFSSSALFWYGENKNAIPSQLSGALLLGQRKAANYLGLSGNIHFLGIRLKIGSLPLFTKTLAKNHSNKLTPLHEILEFPLIPNVNDLLQMDESKAIPFIENWLQGIMATPAGEWHIIQKFLREFSLEDDHNFSVNKLSRENGWNQKKTERLFLKYTGFSPRTFIKLLRFRYVIESLKSKPGSYTKAALDLGFYDQSHFIREFQNYTGKNPSSFYDNPPEIAVMLYKLSK